MLKLTFVDQSGISPNSISIGFFGAPDQVLNLTNLKTNSQIPSLDTPPVGGEFPFAGNWFTLDELSEGVGVESFISGRIYVAYGPAWQVLSSGYQPAQAVTDANFFLRYDKVEITYSGKPEDVANLTSIDYWSIPLTLKTFHAQDSTPIDVVSGLLGSTTAQQVHDTLAALTTPPISCLPDLPGNDGKVIPAVVPGSFVQFNEVSPAPRASFARILGPSIYPSVFPKQGIPVTPYDLLVGYLDHLHAQFGPGTQVGAVIPGLGNGAFANLGGTFHGVGPTVPPTGPKAKQDYQLVATIDDARNITLTGTASQVPGTTTIVFLKEDLLNPQGIYGGNCPFFLDGSTTPQSQPNNVYGWISADLFAGLNIGAIGSTVEAPGMAMAFGQLQSQQWFQFAVEDYFSHLQPPPVNPPAAANYSQWAAALVSLTNAYNFAYTDRFARVFARLNPAIADTLQVTLLPGLIETVK